MLSVNLDSVPHKWLIENIFNAIAKTEHPAENELYVNNLQHFELEVKIEKMVNEYRKMELIQNTQHNPSVIKDIKKMIQQYTRMAKATKRCPMDGCTGECASGKCGKCNASVCMQCMCLKNGGPHGKNVCDKLSHTPTEMREAQQGDGGVVVMRRQLNPTVLEFLAKVTEYQQKLDYINEYRQKAIELWNRINRLRFGNETDGIHAPSSSSSSKPVAFCPMPDCNGRVFSKNWRCVACHVKLCSKCEVVIDSSSKNKNDDTDEDADEDTDEDTDGENEHKHNHVCDEDTLKSINLIRQSDTRPCPCCGVNIHKIHGCNQMWCVLCKKLYDWVTGRIIDEQTAFAHNPHYLDYRRAQRESGVTDVQPLPDANNIGCRDFVTRTQILRRHAECGYVQHENPENDFNLNPEFMALDILNRIFRDPFWSTHKDGDRRRLRFNYFKGKITKTEWIIELATIVWGERYNVERRVILQQYMETLHAITWNYVLRKTVAVEFYTQLRQLVELTQTNYKNMSQKFGMRGRLVLLSNSTLDPRG